MSQFDGNGANECKQFSNVPKQLKHQEVKSNTKLFVQLQYEYFSRYILFLEKQSLLQTATPVQMH